MLIGKGDIANVLPYRGDLIYFAAGISDEDIGEDDITAFNREIAELEKLPKDRHLVYFSSLYIFKHTTPFTAYKRVMEKYVRKHFTSWTIVRLGNICWADNPNSFIKKFKEKLKRNSEIVIEEDYRYMLTQKEFLHWIEQIPSGQNYEMNITGKLMSMAEISEAIIKIEM